MKYLLIYHVHDTRGDVCTVCDSEEQRRKLSAEMIGRFHPAHIVEATVDRLHEGAYAHFGPDHELQWLDVGEVKGAGVLATMCAAAEASPTLVAVAHERLRQIEVEKYDGMHDALHDGGELSTAGIGYQTTADLQAKFGSLPSCFWPKTWPFEKSTWKMSSDHFRNRVKGLALGCAEGDRLKAKGGK